MYRAVRWRSNKTNEFFFQINPYSTLLADRGRCRIYRYIWFFLVRFKVGWSIWVLTNPKGEQIAPSRTGSDRFGYGIDNTYIAIFFSYIEHQGFAINWKHISKWCARTTCVDMSSSGSNKHRDRPLKIDSKRLEIVYRKHTRQWLYGYKLRTLFAIFAHVQINTTNKQHMAIYEYSKIYIKHGSDSIKHERTLFINKKLPPRQFIENQPSSQ